jgi:hypothetical protein
VPEPPCTALALLQGLREHFLAVAAALLAGEGEEQGLEPAFYVGHTWLG